MPKFGVNLLLWADKFDRETVDLIPKVAEMGFEGVEIPIFDPDTVDIPHTQAALKTTGLEPIGCNIMGPDRNPIDEDPAIRETGKVYLKRASRLSLNWVEIPSSVPCTAQSGNSSAEAEINKNGIGVLKDSKRSLNSQDSTVSHSPANRSTDLKPTSSTSPKMPSNSPKPWTAHISRFTSIRST